MKRFVAILFCLLALPAFGATCKISQYAEMVQDARGNWVPVGGEPAIAPLEVTIDTETDSAEFDDQTTFVRIICDAKAHFEFGTAPTAATTDPYLAADIAEYFGLRYTGLKVSLLVGL